VQLRPHNGALGQFHIPGLSQGQGCSSEEVTAIILIIKQRRSLRRIVDGGAIVSFGDSYRRFLLFLLRMKCDLLSLHLLNQYLYPIKHLLIRDAGRHVPVMLDLLVEFDARLTHGTHRLD
jgi:hypothetical protein